MAEGSVGLMSVLTITYPNNDRALLTLAELQAAAAGFTITDQNLTSLGNYVSAAITGACRVARATLGAIPPTLREEGVSETFRLKSRQGYISLARKPVVEINTVVENNASLTIGTDIEVDGGLIYKMSGDCRMWWGCGVIEIDYTAGYEIVPDDLKYAAIKFVQSELAKGGYSASAPLRDPTLKRKTIVGVSEYEWWVDPANSNPASTVPAEVMELLEVGGYVRKFGWMS